MVTTARDRVYPALVNVSVITVSYYGGKEVKGGSTGSGAIVSPDGYIVTNQHVVSDGRRFRVTLADRRELPATLVGEDVLTDLAVLKIDPADLLPGERLPFAAFGDSSRLIVGDTVMAMGSPLALSRSVTLGIVSNTERVLTSDTGDDVEELSFERGRTGIYTSWIQHDAAINPGNSGGPLVNLRGEIVGINTIKVGLAGIGLAIPSTLVRPVYEELVAEGQVRRSSIGVAFKSIKRSGFARGVMVNSVSGNSPAERAGLRAGDLVTALNGEPVTVRFAEEVPVFARRIADMPIGSDLTLTYERAGVTHTASITTEQLHKETGDASALRLWGISVREITPQMARDFLLDDTRGVMVTGTRPGGPAETAEPPLFPGDILRAADGRTIDSLRDSVAHYREIMDASPVPERILIEFERRGKSFVTLIRPRPDRRDDPRARCPRRGSACTPRSCCATWPANSARPRPWASASRASTPARSPRSLTCAPATSSPPSTASASPRAARKRPGPLSGASTRCHSLAPPPSPSCATARPSMSKSPSSEHGSRAKKPSKTRTATST